MQTALTILFTTTLLVGTGLAQRQAPAHDLTRAEATFRIADRDHDGKLNQAELRAKGISQAQARQHDADGDGAIDKSEFLVAYRAIVLAGSDGVGGDLENEVTRILAARKAAKEKADAEARARHAQERIKQAELERAEATKRIEAARRAAEARKNAGKTGGDRQRPQRERPVTRPVDG